MPNITVNFSYPVPDKIWSTARTLNKTADWTYEGPDRFWVFVERETGKLAPRAYMTADMDGETYSPPPGELKVEVSAADEPLLATIVAMDYDDSDLPEIELDTPDDETHMEHEYPSPNEIHRYEDITYDPVAGWTFAFATKDMTWDDVRGARDFLLAGSDARVRPDVPDSIKNEWITWRQKLRDIPSTWADKEPWEVLFPVQPTAGIKPPETEEDQ